VLEGTAIEPPAALLHTRDRDRRLGVGAQDDGPVGHPVLFGADQLLAVQDEDVCIALVLDAQLAYRAVAHLAHLQAARFQRIAQQGVRQFQLFQGEQWVKG
jgi:hypothetical protein